jgi:hypothetical protein
MGHLPIINDVFRVTLDWNEVGGVTPHNVMHFHAPSLDESAVATALDISWVSDQWSIIANGLQIQQYTILRLDGSSASQFFTPVPTHPDGIIGGTSGDVVPEACAVLSLHTATRGPKARGRVYMGPLPESVTSDGYIVNTYDREAEEDRWEDWLATMLTASVTPVVASYKHREKFDIVSFRLDAFIGTQRRRLLQTR